MQKITGFVTKCCLEFHAQITSSKQSNLLPEHNRTNTIYA